MWKPTLLWFGTTLLLPAHASVISGRAGTGPLPSRLFRRSALIVGLLVGRLYRRHCSVWKHLRYYCFNRWYHNRPVDFIQSWA